MLKVSWPENARTGARIQPSKWGTRPGRCPHYTCGFFSKWVLSLSICIVQCWVLMWDSVTEPPQGSSVWSQGLHTYTEKHAILGSDWRREQWFPLQDGQEGLCGGGSIGTRSRRIVFDMEMSGKDILGGFPQISFQENKITQNYFRKGRQDKFNKLKLFFNRWDGISQSASCVSTNKFIFEIFSLFILRIHFRKIILAQCRKLHFRINLLFSHQTMTAAATQTKRITES